MVIYQLLHFSLIQKTTGEIHFSEKLRIFLPSKLWACKVVTATDTRGKLFSSRHFLQCFTHTAIPAIVVWLIQLKSATKMNTKVVVHDVTKAANQELRKTESRCQSYGHSKSYKLYILHENDELVVQAAKRLIAVEHGLKSSFLPRNISSMNKDRVCSHATLPDILLFIEETVCSCASAGFVGTV